MSTVLNYQDFIQVDGDELTTDSLKVAAVHGKRHDNVMKIARQRMAEAGAWGLLHFKETRYIDQQNGMTYPAIRMTQAGYQFLVGKMTGKKAVEHQIAFIEAFGAMAAHIKNQREGLSYRRAVHELSCKDSARRGSFHGKGLNERKQEKRELSIEEAALMSASNPPLFLN